MRRLLILAILLGFIALLSCLLVYYSTSSFAQIREIPKEKISPEVAYQCYLEVGVSANREGDYKRAAKALEQAVRFRIKKPELFKELGVAYYGLRETELASGYIEEAISLAPQDPELHFLKSLFLYRLEDLEEALREIELAVKLGSGNAKYQQLSDNIKKEARVEKDFKVIESPRFVVKFDHSQGYPLAVEALKMAELAHQHLSLNFGLFPKERVTIILYFRPDFEMVTNGPSWSGAIYNGKIRIPVNRQNFSSQTLAKVIFHEYTHAVLHQYSRRGIPTWFNEGLAQVVEGIRLKDIEDGSRLADLSSLEGSFLAFDKDRANLAYKTSAAAIHYIIRQHGPRAIEELVQSFAEVKVPDEAFKEVLGLSYNDLNLGIRQKISAAD